MPRHTPQPANNAFRRRFPLELTPDECDQLEQAGQRHGTKRAALLAGLARLLDGPQDEEERRALEIERDQLREQTTAHAERAAALEAELAKLAKEHQTE